jgi:hypothetical protein
MGQDLFRGRPIQVVLKGVYPMQTISSSTSGRHLAAAQLPSLDSRHSQRTDARSLPHSRRRTSARISNVDSLLETGTKSPRSIQIASPGQIAAELAVDAIPFDGELTGGIFLGLRSALLFNAGMGIFALLAYEAWVCMAH